MTDSRPKVLLACNQRVRDNYMMASDIERLEAFDGQVVASDVTADNAGRVSASFAVPSDVRSGNRIVEVTDGTHRRRTSSLNVDDRLVHFCSATWPNFTPPLTPSR
jgi:hypothetical protein